MKKVGNRKKIYSITRLQYDADAHLFVYNLLRAELTTGNRKNRGVSERERECLFSSSLAAYFWRFLCTLNWARFTASSWTSMSASSPRATRMHINTGTRESWSSGGSVQQLHLSHDMGEMRQELLFMQISLTAVVMWVKKATNASVGGFNKCTNSGEWVREKKKV